MLWRKKKAKIVGASAKLAAAERMRNLARKESGADNHDSASGSQAVPVTIIFALAVVFAMMLLDGTMLGSASWHPTGIHGLDQILVSPSIHNFTGDADMDRLITILIRGLAIFLAASVAPFLAAVVYAIAGRNSMNPFIACWAVFIAAPLLYYAMRDYIVPFAHDMLGNF